jgi:hypothetical protein
MQPGGGSARMQADAGGAPLGEGGLDYFSFIAPPQSVLKVRDSVLHTRHSISLPRGCREISLHEKSSRGLIYD